MKNQEHNQGNEMPMEKLFQEAFDNHTEPVGEQDFEQFWSKLEDTGHLKKGRNWQRPLYFFFGSVIVAGLITIYYFSSKTSVEKVNHSSHYKEKASEASIEKSQGEEEAEINEGKTTVAASEKKHLIKQGSSFVPDADASSATQSKTAEVISVNPVLKKDSIGVTAAPEKKKTVTKDSVRIRYVIAVDTVKTVDSLNIKKRKLNKMKGKSK